MLHLSGRVKKCSHPPGIGNSNFLNEIDKLRSRDEIWLRSCCGSFFFQAEDGIRDLTVTGVQTCALPISSASFIRSMLESAWFSAIISWTICRCSGDIGSVAAIFSYTRIRSIFMERRSADRPIGRAHV